MALTFKQFLTLVESQDVVTRVIHDVMDQFAEERRWNKDEMMRVIENRLEGLPEFRNQPEKLHTALMQVEKYLQEM